MSEALFTALHRGFQEYHEKQAMFGLCIAALIGVPIAQHVFDRWWNYTETQSVIDGIETKCFSGAPGKPHGYGPCDPDFPKASRQITVALRYISPVDCQERVGHIRCEASPADTPSLKVGQTWPILASTREPQKIDRAKCISISTDTLVREREPRRRLFGGGFSP